MAAEGSTAFFQVMDTDDNGIVDALELLSTIFITSGMNIMHKLQGQ